MTLQNIMLMNGCNIDSFLTSYIDYEVDYEGLGEAIVSDGYYYELYDGRVVQYNY